MFDGRWRSTFEKGLRPIGAQIRRTGITANHLTLTGLAMATAASLTIAQGWLRAGLVHPLGLLPQQACHPFHQIFQIRAQLAPCWLRQPPERC